VNESYIAHWYGTRICLYEDGERWLMYVGKPKKGKRRKDFASPFLDHVKRTAKEWYGVPMDAWRREMVSSQDDASKTESVIS
jgi:hypothetical protein